MYVDDQGKAKGLPQNKRATKVTFECGIPTSVLGDALIARNFDDEANFRRMDFTKREFEEELEWKQSAMKANKEKAGNDDKTKQIQELLAKTQLMATQASIASPATKACSHPGCDLDGVLRCSRCKRSWYCSQACQKKDWKFHKTICTQAASAPTEAKIEEVEAPAAAAPAAAQ